jgi:hypothetical protein
MKKDIDKVKKEIEEWSKAKGLFSIQEGTANKTNFSIFDKQKKEDGT